MKKLALLISILLILSALTPAVSAAGADTLTIEGAAVEAEAGETVQIPIEIKSNPGFMTLVLYYTLPDGFTLVSAANSASALTFRHDKMSVWYGNNDYSSTGELAVLNVAVPQNAAGTYEIKISLYDGECYNYDDEPVEVAITSASVTVAAAACEHEASFDRFTGLYTCSLCGALCPHDSWANGACVYCGLKCDHSFSVSGNKSVCSLCSFECSSHSTVGLDFNCAVCGFETGADNLLTAGNSFLSDKQLTLGDVHAFESSFELVVGSSETKLNVYDESRDDNVFYDTTISSSNKSDYHSLFTWVRKTATTSQAYMTLCSLWLDYSADEPKLYLVKANSSDTKICEIIPGEAYDITVSLVVRTGAYTVTAKDSSGAVLGTLNGTNSALEGVLTDSSLRFGEKFNSKYLHIQKMNFSDITVTTTEHNISGSHCRDCAVECKHVYNKGGYCSLCGVLGDPITFNDGKNGGGNASSNNANKFAFGDGVLLQNLAKGKQCWDFRDSNGILLGRDYVFKATYNFSSYTHNAANTSGPTRILIWADADVSSTTTKFALILYSDNEKLELAPLATSSGESFERMTLELGVDYDIRVAVRSRATSTAGTYLNVAEIYVNDALMWVKEFKLTAADGISIRLGDHATRMTKEYYSVKNDFGIYFVDSSIEYIGAQEKEDANYYYDTKFDVRFVFGFDNLYLDDVGIKVESDVSNSIAMEGNHGEKITSADKTVLKNIMVNGSVCQPGVDGVGHGGYYIALAITDIFLDTNAVYSFVLTPYLKNHNSSEKSFMDYSYKITITFTDYKMNIGYEKLS